MSYEDRVIYFFYLCAELHRLRGEILYVTILVSQQCCKYRSYVSSKKIKYERQDDKML